MSDVLAAPIQVGWVDPEGGPTAILRRLYVDGGRPDWLVGPWPWHDGLSWIYCCEPPHLSAGAVADLAVLADQGYDVRVEPVAEGRRLLVQLQRREITSD